MKSPCFTNPNTNKNSAITYDQKNKYLHMKKYILGFAIASVVLNCQKPPEGTNKSVIKIENVATYSDDVQGGAVAEGSIADDKSAVKVDLNGVSLSANQGGLEEAMVAFLKSDGYKNAADDAVLKDQWYDFDNVTFKTGSSNQLENGAEQLKNLAAILKAYPDTKIKIGGYTDKTGNEENNLKLSQVRADFIKAELAKNGVGAQVVSAEGYGSKYATADVKATDAERAKDRKMAVRFTK